MAAVLTQVNLAVGDMAAALAFYRRLGLSMRVAPDGRHASAELEAGATLELDTVDFVPEWNTGFAGAVGGGAVIGFTLESREDVDRVYQALAEAGHRPHQPPYDAFWGARYAIVEDPDGYPVGLMSPRQEERRFWPPSRPPKAG